MSFSECFQVRSPPASEEQIEALVEKLRVELPHAYRQFLSEANGAECGPNDRPGDSLRILPCSEVVSFGKDYGIPEHLPMMLCIASDGGGKAFAFDRSASMNPEHWPVTSFELGAPFEDEVGFVAESFAAWAESQFAYEEEEVEVVLTPAQAAMRHRMRLRSASLEADAAFRAKEYSRLVELLAPFEAELTELQSSRLAFARKKQSD